MFKLMIAITTTLSMIFGATANVGSPLGEPLYAEKAWSVQTLGKLRESAQIGNDLEVPVQSQAQTRYQIHLQEQVETLNQIQNQVDEQVMLQTQDQVRVQVQDQLQDQTCDQLQEQDRIHQADTTEPLHLNNRQGAETGICETCGSVRQAGPSENGNKP